MRLLMPKARAKERGTEKQSWKLILMMMMMEQMKEKRKWQQPHSKYQPFLRTGAQHTHR